MKSSQVVLFDMDGVLLDSANAIVESLAFALRETGFGELVEKDLRRYVGPPLHSMVSELIPNEPDEIKNLFTQKYRAHNNEYGPDLTLIFPGITEFLIELSATHELVVATSKLESAAESVLSKKGLTQYFSGIFGTAPNSEDSKADVIGRAIKGKTRSLIRAMVGDRVHDIDGAKAHELVSIGVTWGYALPNELKDAQPHHIVTSPDELMKLIHTLN